MPKIRGRGDAKAMQRYTDSMQPAKRQVVTAAEYLARERDSGTKHELVNGEMVAMAGASVLHNLLSVNIGAALRAMLAGKPCIVLSSDQRVHIPASGLFAYPDVTVVCGRPEFHPEDDQTLVNPKVIVEVLSDSTEAYDRGAKFSHYQSLASFEEYVLVSTRDQRVEHYRRQGAGRWLLTVHTEADAQIAFPALGGAVTLAEVYEKSDAVSAE